jgi:hypothetical protein
MTGRRSKSLSRLIVCSRRAFYPRGHMFHMNTETRMLCVSVHVQIDIGGEHVFHTTARRRKNPVSLEVGFLDSASTW